MRSNSRNAFNKQVCGAGEGSVDFAPGLVLGGGQVVAEMNSSGNWTRGFVYQGSRLLAVQQSNAVYWLHEDPITKSKRVTDVKGNIVSAIELDPWGGETNRSSNSAFQPQNFTSYTRDANHSDEAMFRRYNRYTYCT